MNTRLDGEAPEFVAYETPVRLWEDVRATAVTDADIEETRDELEIGGTTNFVTMLKLDERAIVLAAQLRRFDFGYAKGPGGVGLLESKKGDVAWYGFEAYALRYNEVAAAAAMTQLKEMKAARATERLSKRLSPRLMAVIQGDLDETL